MCFLFYFLSFFSKIKNILQNNFFNSIHIFEESEETKGRHFHFLGVPPLNESIRVIRRAERKDSINETIKDNASIL